MKTLHKIFLVALGSLALPFGGYAAQLIGDLTVTGTQKNQAGPVGIGTANATPATMLQVVDTGTATPRGIVDDQYNTGTNGAQMNWRKARGTFATPTTIATGDLLGRAIFWGHDGSSFIESGNLRFTSEGTIASTRVPSKFDILVGTDAAPTVLTTTASFSGKDGIALTAVGTDKSITATPSGTGMFAVATASGSRIRLGEPPGGAFWALWLGTTTFTGSNDVLETSGSSLAVRAPTSDVIFYSAGTEMGRFTIGTPGLNIVGKLNNYNGIATAGNGVVTVQGAGRSTAQTAAVASVATYTVGASDASFDVSANVNVTTSTAHSFSATCTYTDETNTSRTLTLGFTQLSGATLLTLITNVTGAGPYESLTYHIRCKASTAITIATTGTFTTVTYNVESVILKLQ